MFHPCKHYEVGRSEKQFKGVIMKLEVYLIIDQRKEEDDARKKEEKLQIIEKQQNSTDILFTKLVDSDPQVFFDLAQALGSGAQASNNWKKVAAKLAKEFGMTMTDINSYERGTKDESAEVFLSTWSNMVNATAKKLHSACVDVKNSTAAKILSPYL